MKSSMFRFLPRKPHQHTRENGTALFQGIRTRLTLWYCGVLGAALILFGVSLYLGTQYFLMRPVEDQARQDAQRYMHQWAMDLNHHTCPTSTPPGQPGPSGNNNPVNLTSSVILCFNPDGTLLAGEPTAGLPSMLLANSVVEDALHSSTNCATDTVHAGGLIGSVYRFAQVVPDMEHHGILGVLVVGEPINTQETALSLLLTLLLTTRGGALLCAGLGGLFLAHRALEPARLAWTNQQRFTADASHELRTPLTLMRADAEVLLRGRQQMEKEDAMLLEDVVAETTYMGNIIANLLTLARLDNNLPHQEHEVVSLVALVEKVVQRVQALAAQLEIQIQASHEGTPYVIGDPMLLEQAVLVLLDNALKYNRQGGQVAVHICPQKEYALLEVSDTGVGIESEHLPYLGERFYRVNKARSRKTGGTGLGLSIARGIATTHNGELTLTSVAGQGTTALLTLPLAHQTPFAPPQKE